MTYTLGIHWFCRPACSLKEMIYCEKRGPGILIDIRVRYSWIVLYLAGVLLLTGCVGGKKASISNYTASGRITDLEGNRNSGVSLLISGEHDSDRVGMLPDLVLIVSVISSGIYGGS